MLDALALGGDEDADMDEVLAALTGAAPIAAAATAVAATTAVTKAEPVEAEEAPAPEADEPTPEEVFGNSANLQNDTPEFEPTPAAEGYASELWRTMSTTIPYDDADAYEAAFDMFLEKMDTEVAMLRGQLNMKAAG